MTTGMMTGCRASPAAPAEITLSGERVFSEDLASTWDGTLFVSSIADGGIKPAALGATVADPRIAPGADGTRSILGLLADEASGTLWACSFDASVWGIPGPGDAKGSALKPIDPGTGRLKASVRLSSDGSAVT